MSNVLRNNFFTVPRELVDGGHLATLSGCAVKLYIALMMLAQKHSAVEIEIPAYIAHDLAGLAANSVTSATKELVAAGLVTCSCSIRAVFGGGRRVPILLTGLNRVANAI